MSKTRQWIAIAATQLAGLMAGCVSLDTTKANDCPAGIAAQAIVLWQPYVVFGADPTREGATTPAVAGRLYLYGTQAAAPIVSPGSVQVRLYVDPPVAGAPDSPLEIWNLDAETLKGKLQHDLIGWGYSLLLPWGTYRPDLTHVRLTVRFVPAKGGHPLFTSETHVTLHGDGPPTITSASVVAGAAKQ